MITLNKLAVVYLLFRFSLANAQTDPCDCHNSALTSQYRGAVKHEIHFGDFSKAKNSITSKTIVGWQKIYRSVTKNVETTTPRLPNTPEETLYTLEGKLYFVRHETGIMGMGGDCDLHIEIGTDDPNDLPRAIVEVPKENCALQKQILDKIEEKGFGLEDDIEPGIHVTVVGVGFYDGFHNPKTHGRVQTHGSSWELHPVKSIKFK